MDVREAGRKGGNATASKMTPEQRKARARLGYKAMQEKLKSARLNKPSE